jgi:hypothetical protein
VRSLDDLVRPGDHAFQIATAASLDLLGAYWGNADISSVPGYNNVNITMQLMQ